MVNALGLKAHHITGRVRDVDAVVAWHLRVLDLTLVERGELKGG
jgi:hypothetical protein